MKIGDIAKLLDATVLTGTQEQLQEEVHNACGSDMMSDVLAYVKDQAVLLTGLVNPQVIRTAMMMDMRCIVFVRSKTPTADMLDLAADNHIVVMASTLRMYEACGTLYKNRLGCGEATDGR